MEVISELETTARELYTGSVVLSSPVAGLEASVAIRTFEIGPDGRIGLGLGGGIVADSDPADEYEECLIKARPLLDAVGAGVDLDGRRPDLGPVPPPLRPAPRRPSRGPVHMHPGGSPRIVIVDNYDSFTYNLVQALCTQGAEAVVVRNDTMTIDDGAALGPDGIVISPGPCGPAETGISAALVRDLGERVPILGVCLGHQVIATAFGGTVDRAPRPVPTCVSTRLPGQQGMA